jgi:hypothetical protein
MQHLLGPVLAGIAQDTRSSVQDVEPVTAVDVGRLSWGPECEFLRAERHDMDVGMVDQTFCMRVGGTVGSSIDPTGHPEQTGAGQEFQGTLLRECGPRSEILVTGEMIAGDHVSIVPEETRVTVTPQVTGWTGVAGRPGRPPPGVAAVP